MANKKTAFFFGANSDLSKELIKIYLKKKNYKIYMFSRNIFLMKRFKKIFDKDNKILLKRADLSNINNIMRIIKTIKDINPDHVLYFNGILDSKFLEKKENLKKNIKSINQINAINFLSIAMLSEFFIKKSLIAKKKLTIVGVSSVAGERGKGNNIHYSANKAALTNFLSGIRNKYSKKNIRVITIIPGYIKSKMIRGLNPPSFLCEDPKKLANKIEKTLNQNKDIYFSFFWRLIMLGIKLIPEKIFKKVKFK